MWLTRDLINSVLGFILIAGTTTSFRFPDEDQGRTMPRTNLVPPPSSSSAPAPSRDTRHHFPSNHRFAAPQQQQPSQWRFPVTPPTTFGSAAAAGQPTGRYWPQANGQNRLPRQHQQHSSRSRQPFQQVASRQHPQPRKLQWEPPVQTMQQAMGYDDLEASASAHHVGNIVLGPGASSGGGVHSQLTTSGSHSSSNNSPTFIVTVDEASCHRCGILKSIASTGCCSKYNLCCQSNIPQPRQNPLQHQPQQSHYPLQGHQVGQAQFYQQSNIHPQGHPRVPAHNFYSDTINIYNPKYGDSQFNPGNDALPYDPYRDPNYDYGNSDSFSPGFAVAEFPTAQDHQQDALESTREPRRSSLVDVVAGFAIAAISSGVRAFAEGRLGGGEQRGGVEHRALG